jgi:hypothetical protein
MSPYYCSADWIMVHENKQTFHFQTFKNRSLSYRATPPTLENRAALTRGVSAPPTMVIPRDELVLGIST